MISNLINGSSVASKSGKSQPVFNPATGEEIDQLGLSSVDEVNAAIAAAAEAAPAWAATPPLKRAGYMFRFNELLAKHADDIAREISREHGKTHDDALGEVQRGKEVVEYACGIPSLLKGEFSRNVGPQIDSYADRQPLGVVAGITPFNFPAMVPMWMYPIAVAAGNTFVLKPSERDPSAVNFVADLFHKAGFPPGVLNVVHGDKLAVDTLLDSPVVQAISFVGSTPIAEYVYQRGTAAGKRIQALGGAKNHMVVMPDADMQQAADALMGAGFGSAGERCMAVSVAVPVGEKTADALVEKLVPMVEALKVGPADDTDAEMGPVITGEAKQRISGLIDSGVKQGADLLVDGRKLSLQGYENGYFLGGSLFDRVTTDMDIYKQEIFGPVLAVQTFRTVAEVIKKANNTPYGLSAGVWTDKGSKIFNMTSQMKAGIVWANSYNQFDPTSPFGGFKESGFGREGGLQGLAAYLDM